MPVDGVERADGVTEEHPAEREPLEPFDVAALAGGESVGRWLVERVAGCEEVGDDRVGEAAGVGESFVGVGGAVSP